MLPEKHRLKTKKDFDYVYEKGKKYRTEFFLAIVTPKDPQELPEVFELPRFGFVASQKVGKAVKRNRAKRRLREIIRQQFPRLKKDFEAVYICFNTLPDSKPDELEDAVVKSLRKFDLFQDSDVSGK